MENKIPGVCFFAAPQEARKRVHTHTQPHAKASAMCVVAVCASESAVALIPRGRIINQASGRAETHSWVSYGGNKAVATYS